MPRGGVDVQLYSFFNLGARWSTPRPGRFTPGKDSVPIVQDAGLGTRAGLDGYGKSRLPQGFDPRTVQPVASRYTDWANSMQYIDNTVFNPTTWTIYNK